MSTEANRWYERVDRVDKRQSTTINCHSCEQRLATIDAGAAHTVTTGHDVAVVEYTTSTLRAIPRVLDHERKPKQPAGEAPPADIEQAETIPTSFGLNIVIYRRKGR